MNRFSLRARKRLVVFLVLFFALLSIGCERPPPRTIPDAGALKREGEALKKQNSDMMKQRK